MTLLEQIMNNFSNTQVIENARVITSDEVGKLVIDGDALNLMSPEEIKKLEELDLTA